MSTERSHVELRATYRVQFRPEFSFADGARMVDYLAALGVSHLYSSPELQAAPGSAHGYDVVDPAAINAELGGSVGQRELVARLHGADMGLVLDIVPNHMAISGPENRWWWDVLENGPASRYAGYFDVDWDPPEAYLRNIVLLPVLADQYGAVLESGGIQLARDDGWFAVRSGELTFPMSPNSMDTTLGRAASAAGSDELAYLADALGGLPPASATDRASSRRRARDVAVLRRALARLLADEPSVGSAIDAAVADTNASTDALHVLLERQNYRLAHWRAARRDLGYRRFFGVNSLAGLRVEDEDVFEDTHRLLLGLVDAGVVDGLRVDHPDGLRDPRGYLERLRSRAPGTWIVVEKILERDEVLRPDWPVGGTTGYDFLNEVGGLFVDPAGEGPLTDLYADILGRRSEYADELYRAKDSVLGEELGSDLNRLTQLFLEVAELHPRHRDHTRDELHAVLRSTLACLPLYRTYVQADAGHVAAADEAAVGTAIEQADLRRPDLTPELFEFLASILLLRTPGALEGELAMQFQQLSGPAMAKGAEDTAFYRYNRLVSLNEVGGDPGHFGVAPAEFHRFAGRLVRDWPRTMTTTGTHDTKRGEDARLRISALSEIPAVWAEAVHRWRAMNARHRVGEWPDPNTEYFLYQTLVGVWPIEPERLASYLEKAMREAKVFTTWSAPNSTYEGAVQDFARQALEDPAFGREIETFLGPIIPAARSSGLSQLLIKLTAPGIPDTFQGSELWDERLVDPDNRRLVDYGLRRRLLGEIANAGPSDVLARMEEGAPKLWLLHRVLAARRTRPELFSPEASYEPVVGEGPRADHAVAFLRSGAALTVAPRLTLGLGDPPNWAGAAVVLPAGRWRSAVSAQVFDAGPIALQELLREFPVALLLADRR